jgi:Flp pilus assembly protein TadG
MIRRRLTDDDRGDASIMLIVVMVALIAMVGLVVDVGGRLRAADEAAYVARQAARAAGQQIETAQAQDGVRPNVTNSGAQAAANAVISASGMAGAVDVSGQTVTVTVTTTYTPQLLGIVGAGTWNVTSSASARVARGITEEG